MIVKALYAHHTGISVGYVGWYLAHLVMSASVWHLMGRLGVVGLVLVGAGACAWVVHRGRRS